MRLEADMPTERSLATTVDSTPLVDSRRREPIIACRADRFCRYKTDIAVYGELLLDEGNPIESIDTVSQLFLRDFEGANPSRQLELSQKLRKEVNAKLKGRLNPGLNLLHDLEREGGMDSSAVGLEQQTWRELFDNSPTSGRLQLVRAIKEETDQWYIKNFGKYLEEWGKILADNPTVSQEDAARQVEAQRKTFEGASKRGQVGLSRQLREKIEASSSGEFSALLGLYKELLVRNGHHMSPSELASPEAWVEDYTKASHGKKRGIINKLNSKIALLITARETKQKPATTTQPETLVFEPVIN